jgi:hypothetical protein
MTTYVPLALAASVALALGAMSLPASAATSPSAMGTGPATSPYCDATQTDIDDNSGDITKKLEAKGYSVDSLEAAGGCLEAFVHQGKTAEVLRLDPTYLTPVGSQG